MEIDLLVDRRVLKAKFESRLGGQREFARWGLGSRSAQPSSTHLETLCNVSLPIEIH